MALSSCLSTRAWTGSCNGATRSASRSAALQGCRELKFRADGIRIIYRIAAGCIEVIEVIAIGKRDKGRVFDVAAWRVEEHDVDAGAEDVGEDG